MQSNIGNEKKLIFDKNRLDSIAQSLCLFLVET